MNFQHAFKPESNRWNIRAYNEIYTEYLEPHRYFRELSNMMYEELKKTFAACDDSISFMAVIILSWSEQTYVEVMLLQPVRVCSQTEDDWSNRRQ